MDKDKINQTFFSKCFGDDVLYHFILGYCFTNGIDPSLLEFIGGGESSLVFSYLSQVIKFTTICYVDQTGKRIPINEYLKDTSAVLKVNSEEIFDLLTVMIVDKVEMICPDDLYSLYRQLRNDGYLWSDIKDDNVGFINSSFVLIDYGQLINLHYLNLYQKNNAISYHRNYVPSYDALYRLEANNFPLEFICFDQKFKTFDILKFLSNQYIVLELLEDKLQVDYTFLNAIKFFLEEYLQGGYNTIIQSQIVFSGLSIIEKYFVEEYDILYEKYLTMMDRSQMKKKSIYKNLN